MQRAFNRTILELKSTLAGLYIKLKLSFNRTILELKLGCKRLLPRCFYAFNRTILELKCAGAFANLSFKELLIVPYWN